MENNVFKSQANVGELRKTILEVSGKITVDMLRRVSKNVHNMLGFCVAVNDGYFQQRL